MKALVTQLEDINNRILGLVNSGKISAKVNKWISEFNTGSLQIDVNLANEILSELLGPGYSQVTDVEKIQLSRDLLDLILSQICIQYFREITKISQQLADAGVNPDVDLTGIPIVMKGGAARLNVNIEEPLRLLITSLQERTVDINHLSSVVSELVDQRTQSISEKDKKKIRRRVSSIFKYCGVDNLLLNLGGGVLDENQRRQILNIITGLYILSELGSVPIDSLNVTDKIKETLLQLEGIVASLRTADLLVRTLQVSDKIDESKRSLVFHQQPTLSTEESEARIAAAVSQVQKQFSGLFDEVQHREHIINGIRAVRIYNSKRVSPGVYTVTTINGKKRIVINNDGTPKEDLNLPAGQMQVLEILEGVDEISRPTVETYVTTSLEALAVWNDIIGFSGTFSPIIKDTLRALGFEYSKSAAGLFASGVISTLVETQDGIVAMIADYIKRLYASGTPNIQIILTPNNGISDFIWNNLRDLYVNSVLESLKGRDDLESLRRVLRFLITSKGKNYFQNGPLFRLCQSVGIQLQVNLTEISSVELADAIISEIKKLSNHSDIVRMFISSLESELRDEILNRVLVISSDLDIEIRRHLTRFLGLQPTDDERMQAVKAILKEIGIQRLTFLDSMTAYDEQQLLEEILFKLSPEQKRVLLRVIVTKLVKRGLINVIIGDAFVLGRGWNPGPMADKDTVQYLSWNDTKIDVTEWLINFEQMTGTQLEQAIGRVDLRGDARFSRSIYTKKIIQITSLESALAHSKVRELAKKNGGLDINSLMSILEDITGENERLVLMNSGIIRLNIVQQFVDQMRHTGEGRPTFGKVIELLTQLGVNIDKENKDVLVQIFGDSFVEMLKQALKDPRVSIMLIPEEVWFKLYLLRYYLGILESVVGREVVQMFKLKILEIFAAKIGEIVSTDEYTLLINELLLNVTQLLLSSSQQNKDKDITVKFLNYLRNLCKFGRILARGRARYEKIDRRMLARLDEFRRRLNTRANLQVEIEMIRSQISHYEQLLAIISGEIQQQQPEFLDRIKNELDRLRRDLDQKEKLLASLQISFFEKLRYYITSTWFSFGAYGVRGIISLAYTNRRLSVDKQNVFKALISENDHNLRSTTEHQTVALSPSFFILNALMIHNSRSHTLSPIRILSDDDINRAWAWISFVNRYKTFDRISFSGLSVDDFMMYLIRNDFIGFSRIISIDRKVNWLRRLLVPISGINRTLDERIISLLSRLPSKSIVHTVVQQMSHAGLDLETFESVARKLLSADSRGAQVSTNSQKIIELLSDFAVLASGVSPSSVDRLNQIKQIFISILEKQISVDRTSLSIRDRIEYEVFRVVPVRKLFNIINGMVEDSLSVSAQQGDESRRQVITEVYNKLRSGDEKTGIMSYILPAFDKIIIAQIISLFSDEERIREMAQIIGLPQDTINMIIRIRTKVADVVRESSSVEDLVGRLSRTIPVNRIFKSIIYLVEMEILRTVDLFREELTVDEIKKILEEYFGPIVTKEKIVSLKQQGLEQSGLKTVITVTHPFMQRYETVIHEGRKHLPRVSYTAIKNIDLLLKDRISSHLVDMFAAVSNRRYHRKFEGQISDKVSDIITEIEPELKIYVSQYAQKLKEEGAPTCYTITKDGQYELLYYMVEDEIQAKQELQKLQRLKSVLGNKIVRFNSYYKNIEGKHFIIIVREKTIPITHEGIDEMEAKRGIVEIQKMLWY
ncbi:MAG: hypothetical protein QXI58_03415, partial [Candidatus Micrarchaeia archaeon]